MLIPRRLRLGRSESCCSESAVFKMSSSDIFGMSMTCFSMVFSDCERESMAFMGRSKGSDRSRSFDVSFGLTGDGRRRLSELERTERGVYFLFRQIGSLEQRMLEKNQ